ncbi:MAG: hypothetical protein J6Y98_08470 [Bacteroidales bacterium]|nr:hypothetical protein [Bacteroidales bacterium]
MKLGFAINTISAGAGSPWSRNDENGWTKHIGDLRPLLNSWSNPNNEPIDFIRFIDEGVMLVSIMPISGRPNDLCSYYFFVPRLAQVTGKELLDIAHEFIAANGAVKELEEIVTREFPQRKNPFPCKPSAQTPRWALRNYDDEAQLAKLIGSECYQNYYDEFNAIFLVKKGTSVKPVQGSQIVDISDKKIVEVVTMLPPSPETLQRVFGRRNVDICFKSKTGDMVKLPPVILQRGQSLSLFAIRPGFEPLKCMITADNDYQEGRLQSDIVKWVCQISPDRFVVKARGDVNAIVDNYVIKLNGHPMGPNGIRLLEEECMSCNLSVTAPGYEDWTPGFYPNQINILKYDKLDIFLSPRKSEGGKYYVELADHSRADIKIRDNGGKLLKGYYLDKDKCYYYNGARAITMTLLAFLAGVLLVAAIWAIIGHSSGTDNGKTNVTPEEKIAQVVNYLESHDDFLSDDFVRLDTFTTLLECMNCYNYDALVPMLTVLSSDSSSKADELLKFKDKGIVHKDLFGDGAKLNYNKYKESLEEGVKIYNLLSEKKWNLDEFKKYQLTEQLFNILNDGKYSQIKKMPRSLIQHPKVKPIYEFIQNKNFKDYQFQKNNGHFLPQKDKEITIDGYLTIIKPLIDTHKESPSNNKKNTQTKQKAGRSDRDDN